jgi:uncharacterized membrane protein
LKLIFFLALISLTLVTGVFWGTWFSLSRSIEVFSAEEFIHIGKAIIQNLAVPMRIIMPTSIVFMALSVWCYPDKRSGGFYFCIAALILIIAALLITLLIEVPIDNEIKIWSIPSMPKEWETIRDRWEFYHTVRTFISLTSFGSLVVSVLFLLRMKAE